LLVVLSFLVTPLTPSTALSWGNPELLVEINDASLTKQDFIDWWQIWKEPDTPLPETPDAFIDWMLQFQEAENMQLYDRPAYRKKVAVFLRVRALMLLKQEEVDSRISPPTRDDLWPLYEQKYLPRFNLKMVSVETEEARRTVEEALAGGATLGVAAEQAGLLDSPSYMDQTGLMRPAKLPAPLLEAVQKVRPGETGGPVPFAHYTYFFEVLERDDGTDEDFETLRKGLAEQWGKQQVARLTSELIERLRTKYQVEVNDELVDKIGFEPLDPETAGQVAVQIGNIQVLAQTVQESVAKDYRLRYGQHGDHSQVLAKVRRRVIADMVSQTVSGMEALDRHYEEQEPFRKTYRFYCQNRMIKELEQELIASQISITDADIEAAYRENIEAFTRKGLVELAMVQTKEKELARLIEGSLQQGEAFHKAVAPVAPRGVEVQKVPLDHLQEPVKEALASMTPGQVSQMISVGEEFFFVKLIKRGEGQVAPLEMVREQVKTDLGQKRFQQASSDLLAQLRERSRIKVKGRAWRQVVEQLKREQYDNPEQ
jgi:parvulin-like peptidyl-prolyl isomerase